MIETILFSFNRAMQLDALLRSIERFWQVPDSRFTVLFHTTAEHAASYAELRAAWDRPWLGFIEREARPRRLAPLAVRLLRPSNLYRFAKYPYLRAASDDFKWMVEEIIASSPRSLVMFLCDDTVFFRPAQLPESVRHAFAERPDDMSFRFFLGENIRGCPANVERLADHCRWDYHMPGSVRDWAYPFAIDATVYGRDAMRRELWWTLYHNPLGLELFVESNARRRRLFSHGFSPLRSVLVNLPLNRVSIITGCNATAPQLSNDNLLRRYQEGFRMEYVLPAEIETWPHHLEAAVFRRGADMIRVNCADLPRIGVAALGGAPSAPLSS